MLFGLIKNKVVGNELDAVLNQSKLLQRHTPDLTELQAQFGHNVFVYNQTKRNDPEHKVFKGPKFYRGLGYTASRDFVMYKKDLGLESFPIVLEITEDQKLGIDNSLLGEPGQIMGEVFSTRWESIVELDQYHLNMVQFNRIRVAVIVPFQLEGTDQWNHKEIPVWMYVGNPEFWNPQLFSSEAKKLFKPSHRLIAEKSYKDEELGAFYTFDYKVEAHPS